MPHDIAITPIEDAIRALLVADTGSGGLTTLITTKATALGGGPAIYDDGTAPQGATMPYVTIGAWTQTPEHTLVPNGVGYGWNCTGQLKAVGQNRSSEDPIRRIMSRIFTLLYQGRRLSVAGYGSAYCDDFVLQPTLKTIVSGVITFEVVAILRVIVHD